MSNLIDHGGPVLTNLAVLPIFWGTAWDAAQPLSDGIVNGLDTLLKGPYMRALVQYRGSAPGSILARVSEKGSEPPAVVGADSIGSFVHDLLIARPDLDFNQGDGRCYMVFTIGPTTPGGNGFHTFTGHDGKVCSVAWVETADAAETLARASHELVEACTNPFPGIKPGFVDVAGQEVSDLCFPQKGLTEGQVLASYYWSNTDGACLLPGRTFRIHVDPDECGIGPAMNRTSVLRAEFVVVPPWLDVSGLLPLEEPMYQWVYDDTQVTPIGAIDTKRFEVAWAQLDGVYESTITFEARYASGLTLQAFIRVRPRTPHEAHLMMVICQLRKFLASENRLPKVLFHKLGPDPAPLPAAADLKELRQFSEEVGRQVAAISRLAEDRLK